MMYALGVCFIAFLCLEVSVDFTHIFCCYRTGTWRYGGLSDRESTLKTIGNLFAQTVWKPGSKSLPGFF